MKLSRIKTLKCLVLFILIHFFAFASNAQSRYGKMLPKGCIYALNTKSKKLYAGIDNPLFVDFHTDSCEYYFLKTNNGEIYTLNDTIYIMPNRPGKARIRLFTACNKDTVEQGYLFITTEGLPSPKLTIDDQIINENTTISKEQLLQANTFQIFISDDITGSYTWSTITSYEFGYNFGGYFISYKAESNIIDNGAKEFIGRLNPGKLLTLKVRISSKGNIQKYLPLYRLTIH